MERRGCRCSLLLTIAGAFCAATITKIDICVKYQVASRWRGAHSAQVSFSDDGSQRLCSENEIKGEKAVRVYIKIVRCGLSAQAHVKALRGTDWRAAIVEAVVDKSVFTIG
jgi:hypothetical protein